MRAVWLPGLLLSAGFLAPVAHAAPAFDDIACAEVADGPPKGARSLLESVLPTIHQVRQATHQGAALPRPPTSVLQAWLEPDLPRDALGAHAVQVHTEAGDTLVIEVQAPVRPALVEANVTAIVDTSRAMSTVFTRDHPPLQDGPATKLQRPVRRLDLVKEALYQLVEELPTGSQLTLVAADGTLGRIVLAPSTSSEAMKRAIDLLDVGMLEPHDAQLTGLLEEAGREGFKRCSDNRAFLFTHHTENTTMSNVVKAIRSFGAADAQIWTFGTGTYEVIDPLLFVENQPSNRATWILNARSDAALVWRTLFSAGGTSATGVVLRVEADGEPLLEREIGAMSSGGQHTELIEIPADRGIQVTLAATDSPASPIETVVAGPDDVPLWAQARLGANRWAAGLDPELSGPLRGPAAELAAWAVRTGAAPAPSPSVWLTRAWADPGPGGPYVVVDIAPGVADFEPTRVQLELGDAVVEPIAWEGTDRSWRLVFPGSAEQTRVLYQGERGWWTPVLAPGIRSANDVIIRHGRAAGATETLLPDGIAAAEQYAPDEILTGLVARLHFDLELLDGAATWAQRCLEAETSSIAIDCRLVLGSVLEARDQDPDAEQVYLVGLKRFPLAHPLWFAAGEIALRAENDDLAEYRYLEAMATGASSNPTCIRLADVMDRRGLPGLAAIALSRLLLVDPTEDAVRDRLFAYFKAGWEKAPKKWGELGTVVPPRGKTSVAWLKTLLFRWGQAYRRELAVNPGSKSRWHTEIPRPFEVIRFENTLMSGAYRIGYTPGTIPANRVKYADEIEALLANEQPPIR